MLIAWQIQAIVIYAKRILSITWKPNEKFILVANLISFARKPVKMYLWCKVVKLCHVRGVKSENTISTWSKSISKTGLKNICAPWIVLVYFRKSKYYYILVKKTEFILSFSLMSSKLENLKDKNFFFFAKISVSWKFVDLVQR